MAQIAFTVEANYLCSRCDFAGAVAAEHADSTLGLGSRSYSLELVPARCRPGSPVTATKVHLKNYGCLQLAAASCEVAT